MTSRHRFLLLPAGLTAVLLLSACGGSSDSDSGVASIAGSSSAPAASAASSKVTEKQALTYVECLRGQGLDVPDPTVDADGNVTLPRPDPGAAGGTMPDRDTFTKAQKACGEAPEGLVGGFDQADQTAIQDAALKFAKCLRSEGLDVKDPDFSAMGQGGPGADGGPGAGGGPFGNLDQDDPKVQAAQKACQSIMADVFSGSQT